MTIWYFLLAYCLAGIGYWIIASVGQTIAAIGRKATPEGHLDVQLKFGTISRLFILSAFLISPVVIAYAGEHSSDYREALERSNTMLLLYMAIVIGWMIKLQVQLNMLRNRES